MFKFFIGLLVLGLVVFIHELGHFFAAKIFGVTVESFSIGWGPVIFRKKKGVTEYRLSAIPLGGYCGMKGEYAFREALDKKLPEVPKEEGSLFSVHPFKRMLIAFAGPFANLLLAAAVLSIVSALGQTYYTTDNRIIPVYHFEADDTSPARTADLKAGDRITDINGRKIDTFADIQQVIAVHPEEELILVIERGGERLTKAIRPVLNKKTGSGQIGIYRYIPLEIAAVRKDSAADLAGILPDDRIIAIDGTAVDNQIALTYFFKGYAEKTALIRLVRSGDTVELPVNLVRTENGSIDLGLEWKFLKITEEGTGFLRSIGKGVLRTGALMHVTVKSFTFLFKGINVSEAVAGPVRISSLIGSIAKESFGENIRAGIVNVSEIVAVICVSLFLMNLLPIPILDGGLILFALIECLFRKQIHPRILYYVQFIGIAFIAVLFFFAIWTDILFIMK
ncbi:MAG: RIP metalloprotease RseP [Treponema sp.]